MAINKEFETAADIAGTAPGSDDAARRTRRVRDVLTAGGLVVSAVAIAALLLSRPWGERNQLVYSDVAPVRDAAWMGITFDALMLTVLGVCFALVVCRMAVAKGSRLADIGAVFAILGGVVWAMGLYAFASLAWYATDTSVLDEAAGVAIIDAALTNPMHGMIFVQLGFVAQNLGIVLLCIALMRSKAVPLWLPIAIIVAWLCSFVFPSAALDYTQALQMLLIASVGVMFLRSRRR